MQIMSRIMRNLEEGYFFKKNNSCQCEEHVHERGYAKSLLGFKVFLQCTIKRFEANKVKRMTVFTQISRDLE